MSLIADEEDELYRKRGIGPFGSPLDLKADAYLREEKQRKEREASAWQEKLKAARYSTYSALDTNPDEYAQARALGAQTGVSPEAAMDYQADLKRQARMESIDFGALPPVLVKALSSGSGFSSIAHDDIENLSNVEKDLRTLGSNAGKAAAASVPQLSADLWNLGRMWLESPSLDMTIANRALGGPTSAEASQGLLARAAPTFERMANQQQQLADSIMPRAEGAVESGVYSGIASIPTAAIGVGLSIAVGNPFPAMALAGGTATGRAYGQARGKGIDPVTAQSFALSQGVIEAGLEALPVSRFLKSIEGGDDFLKMLTKQFMIEAPSEQVTTVLQDLNEWAILKPEATFGDYLAERPRAAAETFIATAVATAGLVSGAKGVNTLISREQKQQAQIQQAETDSAILSNLEEAVQQSALRGRAPDAFAQFVKDVVDSDGVDTPYVFIDGQRLAQSEIAPALAEISPSVAQQLPGAAENGGDVRIPMEEYLTYISGTKIAEAIRDELKLDPDGLPFGQAKALYQSESVERPKEAREKSAKQLQRQAEIKKLSEENRTKQSEIDQIRSDIYRRLEEQKRFSPDTNNAYAALPAAFFATMAERTGESAASLYEKYKAGIILQSVSEKVEETFQGNPITGYFIPKSKSPGFTKNYIKLLRNTTMGTFLHESGHWFLDSYTQMAETSEALKADMDVLLKWFGVEDLKTWNAMTMDEQRENHERFARGFEHYLMEGRAPSMEMQSFFDRFKSWLKSIYKSFTELNVDLNDEVRGVMDRMLATDAQIEEAERARGLAPIFSTPEEAQALGVDWQAYQQAQQEAIDAARAALDARRIADMTWANRLREKTIKRFNKDALEKRKEVKAEVEAEVSAKPIYQAIRFLRDGEITRDGEEIKVEQGNKLDLKAVSALFPEGSLETVNWKSLGVGQRGMLAEENGLAPDIVAEIFGFRSGEAMVRELVEAAPIDAAVNDLTDQRMLERFGDITSEEALGKAADEAIFNEVRARFVAGELAALKQALGGDRVLQMMAKERARAIVENTLVKDLKVLRRNSAMAAARAGKAAEKAFKEQDIAEAAEQKRKQLVQLEAAKLANEARSGAKDTLRFFKGIVRRPDENLAKTRSVEVINAARFILAQYGLADKRVDTDDRMDVLEQYAPEIYASLEYQLVFAQRNAKPFAELTVSELTGLKDVIDSLWVISRREKLVEIDGRKMDKAVAIQKMLFALNALPTKPSGVGINYAPSAADKAKRALQGVLAAHRRVEHWVDNLDNGDIKGAMRTYLFQPISEASDKMRVQQTAALKQVDALIKAVSPTFSGQQIDAERELNYTFGNGTGGLGHVELLAALLNTGNESNKKYLLIGRGWGTLREDGSLDSSRWDAFIARMISEGKLVKEHFDFLQGVWNLLESLKPDAQKAYRTIFGTYFDEVTAKEFSTPFGDYSGGYYPVVADPFINQDVEQQQAMNVITEGADHMFPVTPRGFTKSRQDVYRPLALDLRLIGQHVNKVLLFSNLSVPVRDVLSLLRDEKLKNRINQLNPTAYNDMLLPWLNRAAKQIVEAPKAGSAGKLSGWLFRGLRRSVGAAFMFGNVTNALQNFTGLSVASIKVDDAYLAKSLAQCTTSYFKIQEEITKASDFMDQRLKSTRHLITQEIEEILINPNAYQKSARFMHRNAYFMQQATQNVVDTVVWHAAYNQALAKSPDERSAIREANAAVRQTQGSLNPEDVSRVETGTAFERLFSQFLSYFNMQANLIATEAAKTRRANISTREKAQKLGALYMRGLAIPAALGVVIALAVKGGLSDDDEDGYLKNFLAAFVGVQLAPLGHLGTFANAGIKTYFTNSPMDDRMAFSPVLDTLSTAWMMTKSVPRAITGQGSPGKAIRDAGVVASVASGVPVKPLTDRAGYVADVVTGREKPYNGFDFFRGLVTGRAHH